MEEVGATKINGSHFGFFFLALSIKTPLPESTVQGTRSLFCTASKRLRGSQGHEVLLHARVGGCGRVMSEKRTGGNVSDKAGRSLEPLRDTQQHNQYFFGLLPGFDLGRIFPENLKTPHITPPSSLRL